MNIYTYDKPPHKILKNEFGHDIFILYLIKEKYIKTRSGKRKRF